ncbi:MAG: hypothetical protein ACC614_10830 [Methanobacterium formicicum]|uniref:hypothetical protein n=1 Tax=Methanobacterium formicicum TaxID=2162 RepID=UPI003531458C
MVIAKAEWFKRKNGGFFSHKMPWQGIVYLIITVSVLLTGILISQDLIPNLIVIAAFLFLFTDAMNASLKSMDEREKQHYSIVMTNTAWGMIITMIIISIVLSNFNGIKANLSVLFIITAIVGGVISLVTRHKLERES